MERALLSNRPKWCAALRCSGFLSFFIHAQETRRACKKLAVALLQGRPLVLLLTPNTASKHPASRHRRRYSSLSLCLQGSHKARAANREQGQGQRASAGQDRAGQGSSAPAEIYVRL